MNCVRVESNVNLEKIGEKLKGNVDKSSFLSIILEAISEFKKIEYKNSDVREFFYNIVFETVFSIEEDNSYVLEYIGYFKSNVPFQMYCFENMIHNLKKPMVYNKPYLLRERNNDKIEIKKSVYSIGKDKNEADYIITNPPMGNRHAEIITKGNHFYICDKGSINRTFIEEREIPPEEVIEIFDGARLKFADEQFTFYLKNQGRDVTK